MPHYSLAQKPKEMIRWASCIAAGIELKWKDSKNTPVLIYRGMSGVAHATAVSLAYTAKTGKELFMIYSRKPDEQSHGSSMEFEPSLFYDGKFNMDLIFVDDFSETGETFVSVLEHFQSYFYEGYHSYFNEIDVFYVNKRSESVCKLDDHVNAIFGSYARRDRVAKFFKEVCHKDV